MNLQATQIIFDGSLNVRSQETSQFLLPGFRVFYSGILDIVSKKESSQLITLIIVSHLLLLFPYSTSGGLSTPTRLVFYYSTLRKTIAEKVKDRFVFYSNLVWSS